MTEASRPESAVDTSAPALERYGFIRTQYPGQEGTFLKVEIEVRWLPYLSQQVDGEFIYAESKVIIEVTPQKEIQLVIPETGYTEDAIPLDSGDGIGLLNDAIAGLHARARAA